MNIEKGRQLAEAMLKGSACEPTPASPELMLGDQRLAHEYMELLAAWERLHVGVYVVLDHRTEPDELAIRNIWTDKEQAEHFAKATSDFVKCFDTCIEVIELPINNEYPDPS